MKTLLMTLAVALSVTNAAAAQTFQIRRTQAPVRVDGQLNDAAWANADTISLDYEYQPGDNARAPAKTSCFLSYDDDNLYFACRAFDPRPELIRSHLADRDKPLQDDQITLLLDAFNDQRHAFEFRVTPAGVQLDALMSEQEGFEDFSWDAIWSSAAHVVADGYIVEAAIPFKSLRFPQGSEAQTWGVSFERAYPRSVRHMIRSYQTDRANSCLLCQIPKVVGMEGVKPGDDVELAPTLTASRTDKFPAGTVAPGSAQTDAGLTAQWGVKPDIRLNATLNPDFSQVEADVAQLEVNGRFALRYPERRPFFLDGADYFLTPIEAVHTRTIVDPDAGVKLTAKRGQNSFGVFAAEDQVTSLLFPANQGSSSAFLDHLQSTAAIARYHWDVNSNASVGALYTGRFADGYANNLAGADAFYRLSPTTQLQLQYLRSLTDYPDSIARVAHQDSTSFAGEALSSAVAYQNRLWTFTGNYVQESPGFRADLGFVPQVDVRNARVLARRYIYGRPTQWFSRIALATFADALWDYSGRSTFKDAWLSSEVRGPMQSTFALRGYLQQTLFNNTYYDLAGVTTSASFQPAGSAAFGATATYFSDVDVANSKQANHLKLAATADLYPGRALTINLSDTNDRLNRDGGNVFVANLAQARVLYHFGVRSFARAVVQWQHIERDPALYSRPVQAKQSSLLTQFLFSYKVNPQTVLFLGYSDNRAATQTLDMTPTDRSFFLKVGYAWRL